MARQEWCADCARKTMGACVLHGGSDWTTVQERERDTYRVRAEPWFDRLRIWGYVCNKPLHKPAGEHRGRHPEWWLSYSRPSRERLCENCEPLWVEASEQWA